MELEWLIILLIVAFVIAVLRLKVPNWYGRHYVVSGEEPPEGADRRQ